jgi:RNA polymerase sigma-70 factor (ECF subfamily)
MQQNRSAKHLDPELFNPRSLQIMHGGDHRGDFEQVAVPHMSALYTHALHLTMNSDDAKDLLQETYLKAYRFWDKFEKGTNIKGWLYQIMKNSYINHYRKKVKEPRSVEFDENISHQPHDKSALTDVRNLGEKAPHDIFEDEIASSLASLPGEFRTVVMLSDVEEMTYQEIASTIAVPLGTVRSRLHRGRRMLRKQLRDYARNNRYLL